MSLEVYLYIGITSLYLYISAGMPVFQDGIFHKILSLSSCKLEKSQLSIRKGLTVNFHLWYPVNVGADYPHPFSFCQKQLQTNSESAKMLQNDSYGSR